MEPKEESSLSAGREDHVPIRSINPENTSTVSEEKHISDETLYCVFVGKFSEFQSVKASCQLLKKKNRFSDNIFVVDKDWIGSDH